MLERKLLGPVLLLALLAWTSCSASHSGSNPLEPGSLVSTPIELGRRDVDPERHTLVLVVLDGVRWQDVFHGVEKERALAAGMRTPELLDAHALVPNLHAIAASGAALSGGSSPGIVASGPNFVSIPGYLELFTGRRWTGCTSNGCDPVKIPTIVDELARLPDVKPIDVAVIASWDGVGRAAARDPSRVTLSVGRNQGETRNRLRFDRTASALLDAGERAGPYPGIGDFRRDRATAEIALHYLRSQRPRFLFLGLGESDEYGHREDYRGYLQALSYADHVIGTVAAILADYEREGRATTLLITTDHGRERDFQDHGAQYPESAGVWLVAAGFGIRREGLVTPRVQRHLSDVTATARSLLALPNPDPSSKVLAELVRPGAGELAWSH